MARVKPEGIERKSRFLEKKKIVGKTYYNRNDSPPGSIERSPGNNARDECNQRNQEWHFRRFCQGTQILQAASA